MDFTIRRATAADFPAIDSINVIAWEGGITTHELLEQRYGRVNGAGWRTRITEAVRKHLENDETHAFVAQKGNNIVGYASGHIEAGSEVGVLGYNAVHPDYRGQGIGTALVESALNHLVESGARILQVWTLATDVPACALYEKFGFHELTSFTFYSRGSRPNSGESP